MRRLGERAWRFTVMPEAANAEAAMRLWLPPGISSASWSTRQVPSSTNTRAVPLRAMAVPDWVTMLYVAPEREVK